MPGASEHRPRFTNSSPNLACLGGDPEVGHQGELHAPPDGGAVDRGDHRHVGVEQRIGGRGEPRLAVRGRPTTRSPAPRMICFTSSPEQNAGSAPVITRQRAVVVRTAASSSA